MEEKATDRQSVILAYILYAISPVFPPGTIAGVIVNHLKRAEVSSELCRSHHRWLMRSFWFGVLWVVIGIMTFPLFGIGYVVWLISALWFIYRIVRGWLNFSENKPMYADDLTA